LIASPQALCAAVTTSDLAETLSLLFCGAEVNCYSGESGHPSPLALAEEAGQRLQMEFLSHNKNSEIPRLDADTGSQNLYSVALPSVTHNGFLFKTASMAKPAHERKPREEFSRRWCRLHDGAFSYYENEHATVPSGEIRMQQIVCLVNHPPDTHGVANTFEVYVDSERLYLFGLDSPEAIREWTKCLAKSFIPAPAEGLLNKDFERLGRLHYKGGLNLERAKEGWFALVRSTLYAYLDGSEKEEAIHLRKLQELSIQGDNEVLVLVERRRTLYIQAERKLDFLGWVGAIQKAAGCSGDTLSEQQLTDSEVPIIVDRCIDYITRCGLTSEKSGQNSKTTGLLEVLRRDARRVRLKEEEHHVDDVANTLKRFFREIGDGLFTKDCSQAWLRATAIEDSREKISQYQTLLSCLPVVNRATHAGDFICTVYLEEKKTEAEQHIKIPATMTAEELTFEILDRRKIVTKDKDYWSCFEVSERDEAERPLHYSEKVLPIVHSLGKDSYLVVKRQMAMEHMLVYTGKSHKPEKEWPVKNLKVYLGIKKKVRPSTCWGFTVFFENDKQEKQQWYVAQ
ncbi:PREDICTED: arf-GAP with Rho-GAP domain, ANK repeat and PH domain-containing protein 1-like, partial [Gekko japonicus]|uniref:Arf-GAP with Rho-GAP domain, ANK repeat and PH domain-containing protein 1-like n=1 Tax=Gekko japonicus TaxID=146911 RepID=A0ABM1JXG6_GEKJA